MPRYNVQVMQPDVLRKAGYHQTETGLLYVPPAIRMFSGSSAGNYSDEKEGLRIRAFELQNRTGGTIALGIGTRWGNRHWRGGRLSAADVYTDLSSTMQAASATTLQVAGADQTGFVILSLYPFDWVSVNITTAETDAGGATTVDHTVQYSSSATGWTTVTSDYVLKDDFTADDTVYDAAVHNFVWQRPLDWTKTKSMSATVPDGYYALAFRSAQREAGDVAAIATGIEIGSMLGVNGVQNNTVYASEKTDYFDPRANGVVAFFGSANAGNRVYAEVIPG